jgi:hypothetical protein
MLGLRMPPGDLLGEMMGEQVEEMLGEQVEGQVGEMLGEQVEG